MSGGAGYDTVQQPVDMFAKSAEGIGMSKRYPARTSKMDHLFHNVLPITDNAHAAALRDIDTFPKRRNNNKKIEASATLLLLTSRQGTKSLKSLLHVRNPPGNAEPLL